MHPLHVHRLIEGHIFIEILKQNALTVMNWGDILLLLPWTSSSSGSMRTPLILCLNPSPLLTVVLHDMFAMSTLLCWIMNSTADILHSRINDHLRCKSTCFETSLMVHWILPFSSYFLSPWRIISRGFFSYSFRSAIRTKPIDRTPVQVKIISTISHIRTIRKKVF